jgi:hypothetical protein
MNDPLWLKLQFGSNRSAMSPKLLEHFCRIINSPSGIVAEIEIMLRLIIKSSFATRNGVTLSQLLHFLFCSFYSLQICGMLLLVNIVRVFVFAKVSPENLSKRVLDGRSVDYSHY